MTAWNSVDVADNTLIMAMGRTGSPLEQSSR